MLLPVMLLVLASVGGAAEAPRRVLVLYSFEPGFLMWDEVAAGLRAELERNMPGHVRLYETSLLSSEVAEDPDADSHYVKYLNALFAARPLDLVITVGMPAARFVAANRAHVFPGTPVLYTAAERRAVPVDRLTPNDVLATVSIDVPALVRNILLVRPGTDQIVWLFGNSPIERYWTQQIRALEPALGGRVRFTWYDGLSFGEIKQRVAQLPPHSAVLFALLSTELNGLPPSENEALAELHAVTAAPIFSYVDSYFGKGVVGGPMISTRESVRSAGEAARRILAGEPVSGITVPVQGFAPPRYDWRELRRWHISEANLPVGSRVEYREPRPWEQYRWLIIGVSAILLLQTASILGLLYQRRRRRNAELAAARHLAELAHLNRRVVADQISTSIAHEFNQPLGAILSNAEAAQEMLRSRDPDLAEIRATLTDIQQNVVRASAVLERIRSLLRRAPAESRPLELNGLVREVFELLAKHAASLGVSLNFTPGPTGPRVLGDRTQLQQVVINLLMNAVESMQGQDCRERRIEGAIRDGEGGTVELTVRDTGPGIPEADLQRIFEPFYSTKTGNMGMGLSIVRTIVGQHGGDIRAERDGRGGALLRLTLPLLDPSASIADAYAAGQLS